jgi:hypothetical protein
MQQGGLPASWRPVLVAAVCWSLIGCVSIGPRTIPRDRFDYGTAIADSRKEQLLLNIVRLLLNIVPLRYLEAPVFLDVASVINQYSLEGQLSLRAGVNDSILGGDTLGLGGAGRWADRADRAK